MLAVCRRKRIGGKTHNKEKVFKTVQCRPSLLNQGSVGTVLYADRVAVLFGQVCSCTRTSSLMAGCGRRGKHPPAIQNECLGFRRRSFRTIAAKEHPITP